MENAPCAGLGAGGVAVRYETLPPDFTYFGGRTVGGAPGDLLDLESRHRVAVPVLSDHTVLAASGLALGGQAVVQEKVPDAVLFKDGCGEMDVPQADSLLRCPLITGVHLEPELHRLNGGVVHPAVEEIVGVAVAGGLRVRSAVLEDLRLRGVEGPVAGAVQQARMGGLPAPGGQGRAGEKHGAVAGRQIEQGAPAVDLRLPLPPDDPGPLEVLLLLHRPDGLNGQQIRRVQKVLRQNEEYQSGRGAAGRPPPAGGQSLLFPHDTPSFGRGTSTVTFSPSHA